MIQITKEEAKMLRKKFPEVHISTTVNKQYLEETEKYLRAIPDNAYAAEILDRIDKSRKRSK